MNMKSYNTYFTAALLLLLIGSTTGCFDEITSPEYDGDPKSQFQPTSGTFVDGTGEVALNLQLIAPHQAEDIQIPVSVVDTGGLTTATASEHYELLTETATIPANSSSAEVRVSVLNADLAPGAEEQLTLALEESTGGNVTPAVNFRFFTLLIKGREADVSISPTSISFDSTEVGMTVRDTLTISNTGTRETEISGLAVVDDTSNAFSIANLPSDPFTIATDDEQELFIEFSPTEEGEAGAQLEFGVSNDPDTEEVGAGLTGVGIEP